MLHTGGDIAAQDRSDRELPHHYHGENGLYGPICSNCHGVKSDSLLPWSAISRVTFATRNVDDRIQVKCLPEAPQCDKVVRLPRDQGLSHVQGEHQDEHPDKRPAQHVGGSVALPQVKLQLLVSSDIHSRAEDNTGEQAADYNFCKFLLKENFHRKMTKAADRNVGYFG